MKKTILSISLLLLITGCGDTIVATPDSATISGSVTFLGDWPTTGTIEVAVMEIWDYMAEGYTGIPDKSIPIAQSDVTSNTYDYSLDLLQFKTYNAIIITWLDPEDQNHSTMYHILGAYGGVFPFFTSFGGQDPSAVTASASNHTLIDLDFSADLNLATQ